MTPQKMLKTIFFSRLRWRIAILCCSLIATLFGLLAPYAQKHFIDRIMHIDSSAYFHPLESFSIPALVFFSFAFFLSAQLFSFLANYIGARESVFLQRVYSEQLFLKTLSLRSDSLNSRAAGEIVSLYTTDVPAATVFLEQTLPAGASTLFPLILGPMALHYLFALPLGPVLIIIGTVIAINSALAYRQSRFFYNFKKLAADRVGMVSEWIQNMRTLRILGWVNKFEEKIITKREAETVNRIAMVTNGQVMNSISSSVTFIINLVALMTLLSFKSSVTPGELLALLWILAVFLTRPFRQMPWFFVFGFDGYTSIRRLSDFFSLENQGHTFPRRTSLDIQAPLEGPSIEVEDLCLTINNHQILKGLSFSIKPGEFIGIVGEVGSGKSLLLLSLMGETGADFEKYRINGKNMLSVSQNELCKNFSFVPQEGFVISSSLRDNVAFDYETHGKVDTRVLSSLENSAFSLNNENVADGLETEIGERGVNLSGGQKQRVSIARADFYDSPIILLDDALSAIDVDTERKIINGLFLNRWKNKTRILTTHRLSVLEKVDRILFLEDGRIEALGEFEDLIRTNLKFKKFIEVANEAQ